ncbi:MAG: hypothetical protein ACI81R_003732 [Bradymonadia bacterium]|jgi:hypothetical protein
MSDTTTLWLASTHAFATLAMVGLIWFVQVVHYPLFSAVGEQGYAAYQSSHMARTGWVVGPLMLTEAALTACLVWRCADTAMAGPALLGLLLLLIVWASTAVFSVPAHGRLSAGFDHDTLRRLVNWNWIRTLAWTARGGLSLYLLAALARGTS